MEFGMHTGGRVSNAVENVKLAEELGFEFFGMGDSPFVNRELYSTLSVIGHETSTIRVGPTVTNPITRHPTVTASSIATIDEHTAGRAFLGIAAGDSAVYTIGGKPAKLREIESAVHLIKRLCRGEVVEYNDEDVQIKWMLEDHHSQTERQSHDVPVYIAAEGPKTLEMAGRIADGVLIVGALPELIRSTVENVRRGAENAGRSLDDVDVHLVVNAAIDDDLDAAIDDIKQSLASDAHHSLQTGIEEKQVPDEYLDGVRELVNRYDIHEHGLPDKHNANLVDELGVGRYLAKRFAVAGSVDECVDRLTEIEETGLVDGVLVREHVTGRVEPLIDRFGREVMPHVDE